MEVILERDVILNSLNHIQGIIEKKNTLPILANVLIEASGSKVKLTATDLDIIFVEEIDTQVIEEGSTSTSAAILYNFLKPLIIDGFRTGRSHRNHTKLTFNYF